MGMIETASRIIKRFGQAGTLIKPAEGPTEPQNPWDEPGEGEPTLHPVTVAVVDYEQEHRDGTLIQANDLRALVSVEGLDTAPTLADTLTIAGTHYNIARVMPLAPDGVVRFWELQVRT